MIRNLIVVSFVTFAGLVFSGCDAKRPHPPATGQQPTNGGDTNSTSTEVKEAKLKPSTATIEQGKTFNYNMVFLLENGTEDPVKPDEILSVSLSNTAVGTITKSLSFSAGASSTGKSDIVVQWKRGAKSGTATFKDAADVVTAQQVSGGGGSGSGTPAPTTDLIKKATLSVTGQTDPGQPKQLDLNLEHMDGLTSSNWGLVYPEVDRSHLDNNEASIDADGKIYVAKKNQQVKVRARFVGATGNIGDPDEKWNEVGVSNELTLSSTGAVYTGLWLAAPAYISMGSRFNLRLIDTNTGKDMTSAATFTSSDASRAEIKNSSELHGKNAGMCSISATWSGMTINHKVRTVTGNPRVLAHYDGSGNFVTGVWDTHVRYGEPWRKDATTWYLPVICNGAKPTGFTKPAWFGPPNWHTVNPLPPLEVYKDESGVDWGVHLFEFADGTSTLNVDPFQYVGYWTSPIDKVDFGDDSKWKFPRDGKQSYLWDTHQISTGQGTDFLMSLRRTGNQATGQLDPFAFRVTRWDKP